MSNQSIQPMAYRTLAACLRGGRLPHALLVEGGTAAERLSFAREAAKGALCEAEQVEQPCGVCRHCVKAEKEIHPDIMVFGSEGGVKSFHIDTVREIRQQAYVMPNEAAGKAFVLENVQDMSVQAQNALLKIIEEPPKGVLFILCCENKAFMLETILSRVMAVSLQEQDGKKRDEEQTELWGKAAAVLLALAGYREIDALEAMCAYERDRNGLRGLLEAMRGMVTGLLVPGMEAPEELQNLQKRLGRLQMMSIVAIIDEIAAQTAGNGSGLLLTTTFCARVKRALE